MGWGAIAGAAASVVGGMMSKGAAESGAKEAAEIQAKSQNELLKLQQEWMTPEFKSFSDPFAYFQPSGAGPVQTTGAPTPGIGAGSNVPGGVPAGGGAAAAGPVAQAFQGQEYDPRITSYGAIDNTSTMANQAALKRRIDAIPDEGMRKKALDFYTKQRTALRGNTMQGTLTGMDLPQAGVHYETEQAKAARAAQAGQAGGGAGGPQAPAASVGLSPAQDLLRRQSFALQQQAFGKLSGGLEGMMGDELDLMRRLSAPQEEKARESLFGQQFRMGNLESTPGLDRMQTFEEGLGRVDLSRQLAAIEGARAERGFQQGSFGGGFDIASLQQNMAYRPLQASQALATATRGGGNLNLSGMQQAIGAAAAVPGVRAAGTAGLANAIGNIDFSSMFGGGGGGTPNYGTVPGSQQSQMLAQQDNWF